MSETIGDRIRERRTALGWTQETAAIEAAISRQAWGLLEAGAVANPHLSTLMRVATALQVDLQWLLGNG